MPLLQSGSAGCALDVIYRKDKQAIGAERYTNMGLLLRVLSGVSSVFVRKKHLFSEQVPKEYRRSTEEKGKEPCQNLPKPDNSRHSFPGYLKTGNPVVPSFR
ncbi:hypothetical protein ASE55_11680 [Chryseobacterium sp. Leaf201]|nr:hypothetical protein ASE55_11680 [Chryseobacterium sp. Leaf201]